MRSGWNGKNSTGLSCIVQGGDNTGLQSPLGNQKITVETIDDVDQGTIVGKLATIDQALEHQQALFIPDGDMAIAKLVRRAHANLIRAQGLIQQQADIFQYDHHSLFMNKGYLSMTVDRSGKFDPVATSQSTLGIEYDRLAKPGKSVIAYLMFHTLPAGD